MATKHSALPLPEDVYVHLLELLPLLQYGHVVREARLAEIARRRIPDHRARIERLRAYETMSDVTLLITACCDRDYDVVRKTIPHVDVQTIVTVFESGLWQPKYFDTVMTCLTAIAPAYARKLLQRVIYISPKSPELLSPCLQSRSVDANIVLLLACGLGHTVYSLTQMALETGANIFTLALREHVAVPYSNQNAIALIEKYQQNHVEPPISEQFMYVLRYEYPNAPLPMLQRICRGQNLLATGGMKNARVMFNVLSAQQSKPLIWSPVSTAPPRVKTTASEPQS